MSVPVVDLQPDTPAVQAIHSVLRECAYTVEYLRVCNALSSNGKNTAEWLGCRVFSLNRQIQSIVR